MDATWLMPLLMLVGLELILGIDNIIFIAIIASKVPKDQQKKLRRYGLLLALVARLVLLAMISWIMQLTTDLFKIGDKGISGKDLILIVGGIFLIYKSTKEIWHKMEGVEEAHGTDIKAVGFGALLGQIVIVDIIFSVDSIITAVGVVDQLWIMYVAVIITIGIMLLAAESISDFINKHPSFKILALSFLILVGTTLVMEGFEVHIEKAYIYFAMAFSFAVDWVQMLIHKKSDPVDLHEKYSEEEEKLPKDVL